MTLKYNPFTELAETRARLDRQFGRDNFWETEGAPTAPEWVPAFDIIENDGAIAIKAKLPGIEAKDIAVTLDGNILIVRGQRRNEKEATTENYHGMERICGTFGRSFVLPTHVDTVHIKAEFKDGLLTLVLPKNGAAEVRAIAVAAP
jgi:HSP20 family protein